MATQVQNRRGTTAEHSTFTGANGEVTVDTDKEVVVVHDGTTAGGYPQMRENGSNSALALGSAATPSLKFTGDTNTGIYSPGADQVAISTNGTGRLFVGATGNIGLGISAPGDLLHVMESSASAAAATGASVAQFERAGNAAITISTANTGASSLYFGDTASSTVGSIIYNHSSDSLVFGTSSAERARITSDGKVGIGTTSPNAPLEVRSDGAGSAQIFRVARQNGADAAVFRIDIDADVNEVKYVSAGSTAGAHVWTDSVNERARIDSSGRLLVGTSSALSGYLLSASFTNETPQAQFISSSRSTLVAQRTNGPGNIIIANGTTATAADSIGGSLLLSHYDGSSYLPLAGIAAATDGTPGTNDMPGRIVLSTTAAGSATPTERLRITNDGKVGIGTTNPQQKLEVAESGATTLAIRASNSTGNFSLIRGSTGLNELRSSDTGSIIFSHSAGTAERARIDSSGRFLLGTSTNITSATLQVIGTSTVQRAAAIPEFGLWRSSGTTAAPTVVASGDTIGRLYAVGYDGADYINAARIDVAVDGTPGIDDMPGRIVLSTTLDGASSPTERLRITNDGVMCYDQAAPVSYAAAATLVVGDLKNGIIQYTGAAATLTLPTGTLTEGGFAGIYTNITFEWSVINTGSGTCTIGAGTAHTIVGGATVAAGASGRFASRRTAANTFVSYRLS